MPSISTLFQMPLTAALPHASLPTLPSHTYMPDLHQDAARHDEEEVFDTVPLGLRQVVLRDLATCHNTCVQVAVVQRRLQRVTTHVVKAVECR